MFAVFIGAAIGTLLGLLAGYYEGWWDRLIMRICDVLFAFPGILLAIAVVAVLGSGIANVIIAVAIFSIPRVCPPGARQHAGVETANLY
ncbi:ABC transporter permease [Escherichia coli]|nr:ABC transporter permease [Escherichia coli]